MKLKLVLWQVFIVPLVASFCDSSYLDNGRPVYLFSNCPDFFQLVKHHTSSAKGILLAEPSWMICVTHARTCSLEGSGEWTHAICLEDTRMSQHLILLLTNFIRFTLVYFWSENGKAQSEVIFHIRVLYGHKNISYSKD